MIPTVCHLSYHLRSGFSRRWSPFPSVPLEGPVLLIFTSFLWCRVGGAPDYSKGFHGDFLSDDGESPVTAWREHIHAGKAVGRLTARTDGRLILSSSQAVRQRILIPSLHWFKSSLDSHLSLFIFLFSP